MWIYRSLRRKILVGYFILVLVIATVGVWAIYNVLELVDITKGMQDRIKAGETDAACELYLRDIQPVFSSIREFLQAILGMNDVFAGTPRGGKSELIGGVNYGYGKSPRSR